MSLPPITLKVGDRDITGSHDGLTFSNVDPGGYEVLSANPSAFAGIRPGAPVCARVGLHTIFHGRLNEPRQRQSGQRDSYGLAAVGGSDYMRRGRIQEIYVDSDLTQWSPASVQRRLDLLATNYSSTDGQVVPDSATGAPSLATELTGSWGATTRPLAAAMYASGVPIGSLYYAYKSDPTRVGPFAPADANWWWTARLAADDRIVGVDFTGRLPGTLGATGTGTLNATTASRMVACVDHFYDAAGGADGATYGVYWTCLAVYGRHGLTKRGAATATTPQGFYPDDIAWDAVSRAPGGIVRGRVDQASSYLVQHYVQKTPVAHEKIPLDMAQLMGWHTGVWEPLTMFDASPAWYFHARPSQPTCSVSRFECEDIDLPKVRLDQLYDTAKVTYRDPAGTSGVQTVAIGNPYLQEAGIGGQVLDLDLGVGSASAATAYGTFALKLALAGARGSGSATLPLWIRNSSGGFIASCSLKAGRDRLRLRDLPDAGPLTGNRFDSFRVSRVETTIKSGLPSTRVEFDGGADLMEVLNARMGQARVSGSS
jgi:hypothetical protein